MTIKTIDDLFNESEDAYQSADEVEHYNDAELLAVAYRDLARSAAAMGMSA